MKRLTCILLTILLLAAVMVTPAFAADGGSAAVSTTTVVPGASAELTVSLAGFEGANTVRVIITDDAGMKLDPDKSQWLVNGALTDINSNGNAAWCAEDVTDVNKAVLKLVFTAPAAEGKYTVKCEVLVKNDSKELGTVKASGTVTVDECAKGHSYGSYVSNNDAACTEDGTKTAKCAHCGATDTVADAGSAKGHSYGEWTEKNGKEVRTCSVCGATEEREIEKPAVEFKDVPAGEWYAEPVQWAARKGITAGYGSADTFAPDLECTRAQVVTFLWRAAGEPKPKSSASPFVDVADPNAWFYTAVLWANEQNITNGYGSTTTFCPDVICNRGQVVTFLNRFAGNPTASNPNNPFVDVTDTGAFYYKAVLWANEQNITNGYGSKTTFCPDVNCTRAQIVTFLYRAMN